VAKAIFAGEEIKKLALINAAASRTFLQADIAKFANHFFVVMVHAIEAIGRARINNTETWNDSLTRRLLADTQGVTVTRTDS
jgi:hypothetical protein